MKVKKNDHFTARWLEEGLFHVTVEKINFVSFQSGVPESIGVGFQCALWGEGVACVVRG